MVIHIYNKVYRALETLNQPVNINEYLMQRAYLLEKTLMLGKIEGKSRRGQQRMRWLDSITYLMDMKLRKLEDSGGPQSLLCYSPWGHKELDMT